jgi:hypothetical protein
MAITDEMTQMRYLDLKNNSAFTQQLTIDKSLAGR